MFASNETIRCPACDAENPITRTNCQNCGALLQQEEKFTPLKLGDIGSASESASGKEADLSALPPVPETKLEENPENVVASSRVITMLLGKETKKRLYEHVRNADGIVTIDAVMTEIADIFNGGDADLKK